MKLLNAVVVALFLSGTPLLASGVDDFDPGIVNEQLGLHYKGYYAERLQTLAKRDKWKTVVKHSDAKKRKRTAGWPTVNREEFTLMLADVEKQIASQKGIIHELLVKTAAIFGTEEIDMDETDEDLLGHARILQEAQGFSQREKDLRRLENFRNYLEKLKPGPLEPKLTLKSFKAYLKRQKYEIPVGYEEEAETYLTEYFFPID